ncbi:RNA polymerase sigma factor [Acetivibrio clariflavus]|uniref:RNA polymerase sigma factor, sigma-70 family n=1 Tax=Acetivibrio clariflavus (strain DSM 19732 / NBRC 101661 / EBR45) TaxID=720554 RepID=G8LSY6_ACECE|nr:sigma-70 family RNA polymerase sigma factor [Acetivibrio clariflavus]AEV70499.1 RNA polymerase sigma factor, sigma-70 family [Acetivibrio clariflavus DSM 19732]
MFTDNKIKDKLYEDALSILFSENYERVYKLALSLTSDEELSKDITQITFTRAFEGLDKLKDKSKFSAWVCTIATNVSKDMLRKKINNRKKVVSLYDKNGNIQDYLQDIVDFDNIEEQYEASEMVKYILKYINSLDIEEKQIVHLKYFENYTYAEIAKIMNMKQSTIGMKLLRFKEKLSNKISKIFEEKELSKNGKKMEDSQRRY